MLLFVAKKEGKSLHDYISIPSYERKPGKPRAKPPSLHLNSPETLEYVRTRDKDYNNVELRNLADKIRRSLPPI